MTYHKIYNIYYTHQSHTEDSSKTKELKMQCINDWFTIQFDFYMHLYIHSTMLMKNYEYSCIAYIFLQTFHIYNDFLLCFFLFNDCGLTSIVYINNINSHKHLILVLSLLWHIYILTFWDLLYPCTLTIWDLLYPCTYIASHPCPVSLPLQHTQ